MTQQLGSGQPSRRVRGILGKINMKLPRERTQTAQNYNPACQPSNVFTEMTQHALSDWPTWNGKKKTIINKANGNQQTSLDISLLMQPGVGPCAYGVLRKRVDHVDKPPPPSPPHTHAHTPPSRNKCNYKVNCVQSRSLQVQGKSASWLCWQCRASGEKEGVGGVWVDGGGGVGGVGRLCCEKMWHYTEGCGSTHHPAWPAIYQRINSGRPPDPDPAHPLAGSVS